MFVEIDSVYRNAKNIALISKFTKQVDTDTFYCIKYTLQNGAIIEETFDEENKRNTQYTKVLGSGGGNMFIEVNSVVLNTYMISTVKLDDKKVLYIMQNGEIITEEFDNASDAQEKYEEVLGI